MHGAFYDLLSLISWQQSPYNLFLLAKKQKKVPMWSSCQHRSRLCCQTASSFELMKILSAVSTMGDSQPWDDTAQGWKTMTQNHFQGCVTEEQPSLGKGQGLLPRTLQGPGRGGGGQSLFWSIYYKVTLSTDRQDALELFHLMRFTLKDHLICARLCARC